MIRFQQNSAFKLAMASFFALGALAVALAVGVAHASTAYGTLNNFDCVNDTGVEAHGFDIELDDIHSTDITYTYDYNHYGVPKITQDNTDPAHPKVLVRYAGSWDPNTRTWSAYTAIPSGPIAPTMGHQFTNPSINFGGEHFGVGYTVNPSAVKNNWLIDDGTGHLIHGPPVNVSTPVFNYSPPVPALAQPAAVVAVIVPPPPPALPPLQFGDASWVKEIKTTSHNPNKVELQELVADDPGQPQPWANGETPEVEVEWKILQTEFANLANPKGILQGAPEDQPGGDEIITRRWEFYKYTGPLDAETGEAMADTVAIDGIHGVGTVTYADHFDYGLGEWVTVTTDLSTVVVVGDFFGAQMSGFDLGPALGLIDHLQDGELNVPYVDRSVVVGGNSPYLATITSGNLPDGMKLDEVTGVISGTPTVTGLFTFTIDGTDSSAPPVNTNKVYTLNIAGAGAVTYSVSTSASPAGSGTTSGNGTYNSGASVTVTAVANPGYAFVNWTENGAVVSGLASYNFNIGGARALVANFVAVYSVSTSASPAGSGTTSGDGTYNSGANVTVTAVANPGYAFVNWTENGAVVSGVASYNFNIGGNRVLVANFLPTYSIRTSASPSVDGTTSGDGVYVSGDPVTVLAAANSGYMFMNWTEAGGVVSSLASFSFTASADRTLVANFLPDHPVLTISSAAAVHAGSKVDVTVTVGNGGGLPAQAAAAASKKDVTIDGKATNERPPVSLGTIPSLGAATVTFTFSGIKPGIHTLQATLTYAGGQVTLSTSVSVP